MIEDDEEEYTGPWLYFIQVKGGGPIKIGVTHDIENRMSMLQAWCPFDLNLCAWVEGTLVEEGVLHKLFHGYRIRGEWFEPCDALKTLINRLHEHGFSDEIEALFEAKYAEIEAREAKRTAWAAKHGSKPRKQPSVETRQKMSEANKASRERRKAERGQLRSVNYEQMFRAALVKKASSPQ